ncbi:MAG: lytic transglycosylase domain-containing protein [Firmicutes bacterium]|nr:lytic transglycosylase domain-containing protein [Bacillota bacterium]
MINRSKIIIVKQKYFLLIILILFLFLLSSVRSAPKKASPGEHYFSEKYTAGYKQTILYYNPKLDRKTADKMVRSILYYSYQFGIDPRLSMAVIAMESSFNPKAVSKTGAGGLGQLMPETSLAIGISNSLDYSQNILGTLRLLKVNFDRFPHLSYNKQVEFALASYNAGYGAVLKYNGIPPYPETRKYVSSTISLWRKLSGFK